MTFIEVYAKAGYAARAAVYALIGTLAILLVIGNHGQYTDSKGAVRSLLLQPFGAIILAVLALGLLAYAVWRVLQAIYDYDSRGTDLKGYAVRTGFFLGGLAHAALAYYAVNLIFRFSKSTGGYSEKQVAAWTLSQDFGQILLAAVAIGIAAFGIGQMVIAIQGSFTRGLNLPATKEKWLCRVCKFGLVSRGFIFLIVSWLFMKAALHERSHEAGGVADAWKFLAASPFGSALVAIVGLGLIAFAIYGLTEAAYRDLKPSQA